MRAMRAEAFTGYGDLKQVDFQNLWRRTNGAW